MKRASMICVAMTALVLAASPARALPRRASWGTAGRIHSPAKAFTQALASPVVCSGCWRPALQTSWQWQLQGPVDTSFGVQMYDIDGFEATTSLVNRIHASAGPSGGAAAAVCYIDAGSWENWRPDADRFPDRVKGKSNGWPGERWLDIRRLRVLRPIVADRIQMCADKGFDGIEFDLVDGFTNRTGFPLTASDQLRYDVWLANRAHAMGMSVALKNDLRQISTLVDYFDYALNEQCHQYHECSALDRFIQRGKAVFGVEYRLHVGDFCPQANAHDFNFLKKDLDLRARPRLACRGG
jgi:hypothetical protein